MQPNDRPEAWQRGLLFHATEHPQRHLGQLIVTARVLRPEPEP